MTWTFCRNRGNEKALRYDLCQYKDNEGKERWNGYVKRRFTSIRISSPAMAKMFEVEEDITEMSGSVIKALTITSHSVCDYNRAPSASDLSLPVPCDLNQTVVVPAMGEQPRH